MWERLGREALRNEDESFYFMLYRALMPVERWNSEVLELATSTEDCARLNDELEKRHLKGWGINLEDTFITLLKMRGRDIFPYLRSRLESVFGGWYSKKTDKLIELAKKNEWWDLHTATIRVTGEGKFFNSAVLELLNDRRMAEDIRIGRLKALAGVSREWNWPGLGLARVHSLEDKIASKLYLKYPDLVKGPFLVHVTPRWWRGSKELLNAAFKHDDSELIDILSARYVTHIHYNYFGNKKWDTEETDSLATHYQNVREKNPELFARRAANVLTRVPAYATYGVAQLLKSNALARLLFVRSFGAYLAVPQAVQDLVEGSNIHVQKLAYQVLAQDDPQAQRLAAANIDILIGTLMRPIHRKTRIPAFDALANAAKDDLGVARKIHDKAREALQLPDKRYPKEELMGLIARILANQPELRGDEEQPVIFRAGEAAA